MELKKELSSWLDTINKINNLTDIFDTKKLTITEIEMFLHDVENRKYIDEFFIKIKYLFNIDINQNEIVSEANISYYRLLVKCICANAILEYNKEQEISIKNNNLTEDTFDEIYIKYNGINKYINEKSNKVFFRGQSDFNWNLIPSFFRNYSFTTDFDGEIVDLKRLYDKYNTAGLVEKYNKTIAENRINGYLDLDYGFISYMQHSVSYSPLIDITSKIEIAVQFALGNKSDVNNYLGKHSAVFAFSKEKTYNYDDESTINNLLLNNFKVIVLKKKLEPGTIMKVTTSKDSVEDLDFRTIPKIIEKLTPKFIIIEKMKNDRMKYQHGKFILFYDYVLVNDSVPYLLNRDIKSSKLKIMRQSKNALYATINKRWSQYNMDYLLNPYDYFCK